MSLMKSLLAGAALTLLPLAVAADPALIFDLGGKFDKSFNEAAYQGAERWKAETGGSYKELEMQSEAMREQALRRLAEAGSNPIVMTGFAFGEVLNKVAPDYPDTKFVIIDTSVDQPNVQSVEFRGTGLVSGGRPGGRSLEIRHGRLYRRHGHPADPQVRMWLRPGLQGREAGRQADHQLHRHHARSLERSGQRGRAWSRRRSLRVRT